METIINKKRIAGIMCLIILVGMMVSPFVHADGEENMNANAGTQTAEELKLEKSYPADKDNHLQLENTGIKLFFKGNVIDESVWKNNKTKFKLTTKKGKEVSTKAYASKKSGTNYILVVVNSNSQLKSKSDYIFTIEKGLASADGKVVPEDIVLNYTTIDMEGNTKVNMGLMAVMVVGMIVMTTLSTRRQARKQTNQKEEKVNPYKVAKEKGKSVEEVMAQIEKDKARKAKKNSKKNKDGETFDDEVDDGVYKVKAPRPISAGGSSYKTGRKSAAEKKAKEEAARKAKGTTNPKNKGSKKKGKKKK